MTQHEWTMRDLLQAFQRRRSIVLWTTAVCVLLGGLACVFSTRRYDAVATIELQSQSLGGLDRETLMGGSPVNTDSLAEEITIQTQAKVLQSSTLALRTISALKLTDNKASFQRTDYSVIPNMPFGSATQPDAHADMRNLTPAQVTALKTFKKNLSVKPVGGTRLVEIGYSDPDPLRAAAVANEVVRQLVDYNEQTRGDATRTASDELGRQLEGLRTQSDNLQKRVAEIQQETGTYSIGTTDEQGHEQAYSAVLAQFQRAATTLSDATQNRILKEAIYHVAQSGDAELISGLAGNGAAGASAGVANSLGTIQNLRVQESLLQAQLDQLKVKFGPGYPKVAELEASIRATENAIHDETRRITSRAQNDFAVAERTWQDAQLSYQTLKQQADDLNSKNIQYMITRQEADESRSLYTDLVKRLTAAGIVQGLRSSTITLVDMARAPEAPSKPAIPLYLAASLLFGLLAGCIGAAFKEALDDSIVQGSTVERMGLRLLGILPAGKYSTELEVLNEPRSRYSAAIARMRSALMRTQEATRSKVVVVSAAAPDQSSLRFSTNLAASAAQSGKTVLLVEADPRGIGSIAGQSSKGFNQLLAGEDLGGYVAAHPSVTGLYVLPNGPLAGNTSDLLESQSLQKVMVQWRHSFDLVIVDAPPALFVPDAGLLSEFADATIELAKYGTTTQTALKRSYDSLREHTKGTVGVVLDGVPIKSTAYLNYYGYSEPRNYGQEALA